MVYQVSAMSQQAFPLSSTRGGNVQILDGMAARKQRAEVICRRRRVGDQAPCGDGVWRDLGIASIKVCCPMLRTPVRVADEESVLGVPVPPMVPTAAAGGDRRAEWLASPRGFSVDTKKKELVGNFMLNHMFSAMASATPPRCYLLGEPSQRGLKVLIPRSAVYPE
jgi:hypothetical protein